MHLLTTSLPFRLSTFVSFLPHSRWVQDLPKQYRLYKSGETSNLNEDRINRLLELGLGLDVKTMVSSVWTSAQKVENLTFEKRLEQLQKVKVEMDINDIDHRYHKMGNLGGWLVQISQQHKEWQEGKTKLTPVEEQQLAQLSKLGFLFNVFPCRSRRSWDDNFAAFLQFQNEHGHSNVPNKYKKDIRLAVWVGYVRDEHKALQEGRKNSMTQKKIDKLVKAGFIWMSKQGRGALME